MIPMMIAAGRPNTSVAKMTSLRVLVSASSAALLSARLSNSMTLALSAIASIQEEGLTMRQKGRQPHHVMKVTTTALKLPAA